MDRRTFIKTLPTLTVLADAVPSLAQEPTTASPNFQPIVLPKPEKDGGKSVMAALWDARRTAMSVTRSFPFKCSRICSGPPGA